MTETWEQERQPTGLRFQCQDLSSTPHSHWIKWEERFHHKCQGLGFDNFFTNCSSIVRILFSVRVLAQKDEQRGKKRWLRRQAEWKIYPFTTLANPLSSHTSSFLKEAVKSVGYLGEWQQKGKQAMYDEKHHKSYPMELVTSLGKYCQEDQDTKWDG